MMLFHLLQGVYHLDRGPILPWEDKTSKVAVSMRDALLAAAQVVYKKKRLFHGGTFTW